jgi:hypothetical protein
MAAVVWVGCASGPEPAAVGSALPEPVVRGVLVQSIPRGAYVVCNGGYVGVAPVVVSVEVDGRGHPRRPVQVKVVDSLSGAWRVEVLNPIYPVPERVLVDLREFMGPALSWR